MCGRFVRSRPAQAWADLLGAEPVAALPPSWNVSPSQPVLAARRRRDGVLELVALRWGLVPPWARAPGGRGLINARAETVAVRPAFREAFRRRRCLVAADGFYEWVRGPAGARRPWLFRLRGGAPFAFAGLWARREGPDGTVVETCAILTTEANGLVRPVHARMPVILAEPEAMARWLEGGPGEAGRLRALLRPLAPERMEGWPVGSAVNDPRRDGPALAAPLAEGARP